MAAPIKKIPDMFVRALKRKNVAVDVVETAQKISPSNGSVKTQKVESTAENVQKENQMENSVENSPPSELKLISLITEPGWNALLSEELNKNYALSIENVLNAELKKGIQIFPPRSEIFTAFNISKLEDIRVVIIGQDPYHDDGQAHGMSFSVKKGVKPPPSLKNIYKELATDIPGFVAPSHGDLSGWARQGVFLLNASLTVQAHKANSHAKIGWQRFTDHVIQLISNNSENVVFVLWGGFAHKKESLIDGKKHAVIKTAHPSPLSARYWVGCKCFSKTNEHLEKFGRQPIDWNSL